MIFSGGMQMFDCDSSFLLALSGQSASSAVSISQQLPFLTTFSGCFIQTNIQILMKHVFQIIQFSCLQFEYLIIQVVRQFMIRKEFNIKHLNDQSKNKEIDQFYDPFKTTLPTKNTNNRPMTACVSLFDDDNDQQDFFIEDNFKKNVPEVKEESKGVKQDFVLKKILANSKEPDKKNRKENQKPSLYRQSQMPVIRQYQPFCFNNNIILKYPQTPHFKNQLQSPFWKFNAEHRTHIETLKQKTLKAQFSAIDLNSDPLNFVTESLKYFIGISSTLKEKECIHASRALFKLGCYVQPFNERAWRKYIENEQQYGYIYKAFILSKTAFLFTQHQDFARSYLLNGEKCGVALGQMRGILNSTATPEIFQKGIMAEIGKMTMKHQQIWKGLKILFEICQWNEFRLPVCALIIFLAKYLQNIGQRQKGLSILKRSFGRGMSKLQVYTTYLQMKIRQENGILRDNLIKEILEYIEYISSENRFKLYLQIAEIFFKNGDQRYKYYVEQSYLAAKKYCAPGSGCNKTLRNIYFTILRWKNVEPPFKVCSDSTYFQANRYEFITTGKLNVYQFTDWKYYLHFGLLKKTEVLMEASKKWSYTGRLIAEWIHSLRESRSPRQVLKIWRQKIDQVPKSGQLWCEGGRIYAELQEYENAQKCFKAAIHFTPQYGDSFIEQLRIYLMKGRFMQVHKLNKILLVSQPFYGHVWSFLRESNIGISKLCLKEMWDLATQQINNSLYRTASGQLKSSDKTQRLLTAYSPYNEAYLNPSTPQIRRKLFCSYQQLDNKS